MDDLQISIKEERHKYLFVCLCILHQSCLTITARTVNCPVLGEGRGVGVLRSSLHLFRMELGSLMGQSRKHRVA